MNELGTLMILQTVVVVMWGILFYREVNKLKISVNRLYKIQDMEDSLKPIFNPSPKPDLTNQHHRPSTPKEPKPKFKPPAQGSHRNPVFNIQIQMPSVKPMRGESEIAHSSYGTYDLSFGVLDPNKIYYLCHPATSGGRTLEENKNREEYLYKRIIANNPEVKIIRPLALIPDGMEYQEAMKRCYSFIDASHAIILPLGWQKSTGCSLEHKYSKHIEKEQIFITVA